MPAIPKEVREKLVALGERIRRKRLELGLTMPRLAQEAEGRLAEVHSTWGSGYYQRQTPGMIRGIEMGRTFMTAREVKALAYVLGDASIGDEYERLKKESGQ